MVRLFFENSHFFLMFSAYLVIISKVSIGFLYGYFGYILRSSLAKQFAWSDTHKKGYNLNFINKMSINDLVFILLTLYSFLSLIIWALGLLLGFFTEFFSIDLGIDSLLHILGENSNNSNIIIFLINLHLLCLIQHKQHISSLQSKKREGNSVLMGLGLSAGLKLTQTQPTVASKVWAVAARVFLGSGSIIAKNVSHNLSKDLGTKLISHISNSYIDFSVIFGVGLTGNNALDLLNIILKFNGISILILLMILYNYVLSKIDINYFSQVISQYLSSKYVNYIIKILTKIQKSINIIIILLFILLLASLMLSYYYLDFFIENLDKIIEVYFTKK